MAVGKNDFTARELEIMAHAWSCFDGEPKVDYKKLAGKVGMSNPVSASNAWAKIKKKIAAQGGKSGSDDGDGGVTPKATPAKATPNKKRGKKAADADNGADDNDESPTKKAKAKTPRKTEVKKEVPDDDLADGNGAGDGAGGSSPAKSALPSAAACAAEESGDGLDDVPFF